MCTAVAPAWLTRYWIQMASIPMRRLRIEPAVCRSFLSDLRTARLRVLADAEDVLSVVSAIERLGKWLNPDGDNLGAYEQHLSQLARCAVVSADEAFPRHIAVLRMSRNDYAHGGAAARHMAHEALRVSLTLEEALMTQNTSWSNIKAEDIMVRNPATAERWQLIADIRQTMLVHGFTSLPTLDGSPTKWKLVTDGLLARWLNQPNQPPDGRKKRLSATLEHARKEGLQVLEAETAKPGDTIAKICGNSALTLVLVESGRLLGVISPADVL
jgi:hypothetical protein